MISLAIEDNLCHVYLTSEPRFEYWISFPGSLNRNSLVKLGEESASGNSILGLIQTKLAWK